MLNITGRKKHYERLITVLLNKTDPCRGGNKHKHITVYTQVWVRTDLKLRNNSSITQIDMNIYITH